MLGYYYNCFDLIFFSIQVPDYKKTGDRFGQDSNENEDDGRAFAIDETDLDWYSTVFNDSDEFQIFSESIQRKELTKKHSFKQHQRDTIGYNQASLQSLIAEQRKQ